METPFDYFFNDGTNPRTIEALRDGPLASPLKAYAQRLHEDGYAAHSGFVQLRLLGCFNRWLDRHGLRCEERSLTEATVINYTPVVRSFLSEHFPEEAVHCQQITAGDITEFVQRQAVLVTSKRAPLVVTALRSFLRYLFHRGILAIDLATCVPMGHSQIHTTLLYVQLAPQDVWREYARAVANRAKLISPRMS